MQKIIRLFKTIWIFILLLFVGCQPVKAPAIQFDGTSYKFGETVEGDEVVFTFFFKNTGNTELIIKDLFVSCFCVNIKQYDKVVLPGNKGKIYGVIKTAGFGGDISKSIKVETNVPGSTAAMLILEGKILPAKK